MSKIKTNDAARSGELASDSALLTFTAAMVFAVLPFVGAVLVSIPVIWAGQKLGLIKKD